MDSEHISSKGLCCPSFPQKRKRQNRSSLFHSTNLDSSDTAKIPGGRAEVGTQNPRILADGESPRRWKKVAPFRIDTEAVTIARFAAFVEDTGYVTEAEEFGWSLVFFDMLPESAITEGVVGLEWWRKVIGASWQHPEGLGSDVVGREALPVTHISWADARAFASWAGGRLPTEIEWEHAARGGRTGSVYPWGNREPDDTEFTPCNIWQGSFPAENSSLDGYRWLAPARSFQANGYGLYNCCGNCWEWTADMFRVRSNSKSAHATNAKARKEGARVMKGGSFLCHKNYCYRYRIAARSCGSPDTSAAHLGFRCVYDVSTNTNFK